MNASYQYSRFQDNSTDLIEIQKIHDIESNINTRTQHKTNTSLNETTKIEEHGESKELTTFPKATTFRKVAGRLEEGVSSGSSSASRDAACFIESES